MWYTHPMWALKRRLTYTLFTLLIITVSSFFLFRSHFVKVPTCGDGIKNGGEVGVDCGGSCSLICSSDILPIETVWANFFLNEDRGYDVGVLFLNKNSGSSPKSLTITVILKSAKDETLYEQKIVTPVPLATEFPVVIQNIKLQQKPKKIIVVKEEDYSYVLPKKTVTPVKTEASFDKASGKIIFVTLINTSKKDLFRFPVKVVLYDEKRVPIGVAETFVDKLLKKETKNVEVVLGRKYDTEPGTVRAYTSLDPYAF